MVTYDPKRWAALLVRVGGSVLPRLLGRMALAAILGAMAALAYERRGFHVAPWAHSVVAATLAVWLPLRVQASVAGLRRVEACLGELVCRGEDLVRRAVAYHGTTSGAELRRLVLLFAALVDGALAFKGGSDGTATLSTASERATLEGASSPPTVVLGWMSQHLAAFLREGTADAAIVARMEEDVAALLRAFEACERARVTRAPFVYAQHGGLVLHAFCFTLPFALAEAMGPLTPVAAALVTAALVGTSETSITLESPFEGARDELTTPTLSERLGRGVAELVKAAPEGIAAREC